MGSKSMENDVVFDTGSGWLTIALTECTTCDKP